MSTKHFVVVPFPSFGHFIPISELAKKINQKHKVTFVMSAMKVPSIKERNLLPLDIPVLTFEDGLVDEYDQDLEPSDFMNAIRKMLVPLREIFKRISISQEPFQTPVTAVIMDFMQAEAFEVCHSLGIPTYMFSCPGAWTLVANLDLDKTGTVADDDWFNPNSNSVTMGVPEGLRDLGLALIRSYPLVKAVVVNSFEDLESASKVSFEAHPNTGGTPMKFVGPIFPESQAASPVEEAVKGWLDKQKDRSVIFVSFGTHAIPLPQQITEIADALTTLKMPFIWSLKTPQHDHLPEGIHQKLKKGFEGEFLILPWVPQKLILGHPSTRVFISHCGWNSSLEGIYSGVPFVAWPMFADQHANADFLVKLGMAVKIPNTSVKAKRLVLKRELIDTITKVTEEHGADLQNCYAKTAQEYALKARAAVSLGGKSARDFKELFE